MLTFERMTNIALVSVLIAVNLAILIQLLVLLSKIRKFSRGISDFLLPVAEGQPSALMQLVEVVSTSLARAIAAQFKTTFLGMQSGQSRALKAVEGDIAQDILRQNVPIAGALLDSFPALSRSLKRNPALASVAEMALRRILGGQSPPSGDNHNDEPSFKLGIGGK